MLPEWGEGRHRGWPKSGPAPVLCPEIGLLAPELLKQFDAGPVIHHNDLDAVLPKEIDVAGGIDRISHNDPANFKLNDRPGAHHAWAKRRIHGGVAPRCHAAGGPHGCHLAVNYRIAFLDEHIMSLSKDPAVVVYQHGANRATSFLVTLQGMHIGTIHEIAVIHVQSPVAFIRGCAD